MNLKTFRNILIIIGIFETVFWISGVILENIFIILLATILTVAAIFIVYIQRDNLNEMFQGDNNKIVEDKRTQLINEKSLTMTLGIFIGVIIYVGLIIISLRNIYPQFLLIGCILLLAALFCIILNFLTRAYYKRKYL
jgi:uncharacterized membrane protein